MIVRLMISIILVIILGFAMWSPAAADLAGSRRMARDNARCARMGERYERNGLTARELARLDRRHCVRDSAGWYSGLYYAAGHDSDD